VKFKGSKEALIVKIQSLGYTVEIKESGAGLQFRAADGAIMNLISNDAQPGTPTGLYCT